MQFRFPLSRKRSVALCGLFLLTVLLANPATLAADGEPGESGPLLWSVSKEGEPAGYVLGTIHSEDPRVLDFSEAFLVKLRSNQVYAMEIVPDQQAMASLTGMMRYPPGKSLQSVIGEDRFERLLAALSLYSLPREFVDSMKPWVAMMTLSTPPPETGFFMDMSLSLRASGSGLQVIGLETPEQQLSFLEHMPMPMQLELLDQALDEFGSVDDTHKRMVDAYLENNLASLEEITDEQLSGVAPEAKQYFIEAGINDRNVRMAKTLLAQLEDHMVFVAVGALHLPGEKGLLNLLRLEGFNVQPVSLAFLNSL